VKRPALSAAIGSLGERAAPVHCDIEAGLRQLLSGLTSAPADVTSAGMHLVASVSQVVSRIETQALL
jgi:hypothetical protein